MNQQDTSKAIRESIERGLAQSAAGDVHDLGSFAQYASGVEGVGRRHGRRVI